jgi:hypothetical protein
MSLPAFSWNAVLEVSIACALVSAFAVTILFFTERLERRRICKLQQRLTVKLTTHEPVFISIVGVENAVLNLRAINDVLRAGEISWGPPDKPNVVSVHKLEQLDTLRRAGVRFFEYKPPRRRKRIQQAELEERIHPFWDEN